MEGLKQESIQCVYGAEDVYTELKNLTNDDDFIGNHGLFKIEFDEDNNIATVFYIDQHHADAIDKEERREMLHSGGWLRYYNDYAICEELLRIFGRL